MCQKNKRNYKIYILIIFAFLVNFNTFADTVSVKDSKILIVSFVFSYKFKTKMIGEVYYNKIDEIIKSSELN